MNSSIRYQTPENLNRLDLYEMKIHVGMDEFNPFLNPEFHIHQKYIYNLLVTLSLRVIANL